MPHTELRLLQRNTIAQSARDAELLARTPLLGERIESRVLPLRVDLGGQSLPLEQDLALAALEKRAARTAIESLVSLAKANDIDHLGGGLELIPALLMTLSVIDYERTHFAIEHGHTSIGYYSVLSALGFLPRERVIDSFRRSLDIAGHVSWVPGGTPLGSGRLGVMMPVATGLALGLRARKGNAAFVICHCGDAGWISGQALNGFNAAALHGAPIAFVMHRNGIQLSGTTARIMPRDPRPVIESLGVTIIEIQSLHNRQALFAAYAQAHQLALSGKPSLIYPTGYTSHEGASATVASFGRMYGIGPETERFAEQHGVPVETKAWIPGSLMSFRDTVAMLQCLFYVNNLPGGEAHHDGGMKGRDGGQVLGGPMLQLTPQETQAIVTLEQQPLRIVETVARPPQGTENLLLAAGDLAGIQLPGPGDKPVSARLGSEAAYAVIAKKHPDRCFFVSCDLNPSTKLGKAAALVPPGHQFEMSIEEQAAAMLTDGLSFAAHQGQLNVFATFAAFMEGIAREGFELWRYQRNLNGRNEGLNVVMHFSHVGACTGRDHFSGWSLDWVNLALGYLPFLRRFYAPADARAAFVAVRDAAAGTGGHIVAIPRDTLPILATADGGPLWNINDAWTPVTVARQAEGARVAILAFGAPAFLAIAAGEQASAQGVKTDVHVINGLPLPDGFFAEIADRYDAVLTIEDGLIGDRAAGLRGFAGLVASHLCGSAVRLEHFGIVDSAVAPSDDYLAVWEHYGLTVQGLVDAVKRT
jgi:transketolase